MKQKYTILVERYLTDFVEYVYVELIAESPQEAGDRALDAAADRTDWLLAPIQCRKGMMARRISGAPVQRGATS